MNRQIITVAVLTGMLIVGWGCVPEANEVKPPAPPAKTVAPQPAEPNIVFDHKPLMEKMAAQHTPTKTEPNTHQPAIAKPAPAESNAVTPQANAAAQTPSVELCSKCTEFLSKYVDQGGMVDYKTLLRKKVEMMNLLDNFKKQSRSEYNSWSNDDKLAFWINAYNLELTKIILDNYPIESNRMLRLFWPPNSIQHIKGIWDEHKFIIMDEEFTLRAVEQRFFKSEFSEPRVFFAMSYGSLSGPPLRNEAYCGRNLSTQLDDQVKKFMAGKHAFNIDHDNKTVNLSSILSTTWQGPQFVAKYGTDLKFKQQEPAVRATINFLTKYITPPEISFLETANYTVAYIRYDWTLNERAGQ